MKTIVLITLAAAAYGAEKKIAEKDLPPAVQQAVRDQSKGATVRGFTTEVEGGKTFYEAELTVNGRVKDISFDAGGHIVSIEEETPIDSIPAPARDAIQKATGTGKLVKVETVTEHGSTSYEAAIKRGAKNTEFKVDASGKPVK